MKSNRIPQICPIQAALARAAFFMPGVMPMPRSGGTYSLPPGYLAVTGQTVQATQHNGPLEDLAASMTNSLPRDGTAPMQGELPMGSNKITGLAAGTASNDAATVSQANAAVPVGTVTFFAGSTAPTNWLLCYGQAVSRTTYAALFSAIGTTYGTGDGTTTFNVPDMRGRVGAGKDDMGGTAASRLTSAKSGVAGGTLGGAGGVQEHALTASQNGPHTHTTTDPGHSHQYSRYSTLGSVTPGGSSNIWQSVATQSTVLSQTGISINTSGSGDPHPNVQPTLILNAIIKAL